MKARIISLENQIERRKKMESLMSSANLDWSFFSAISGKDINFSHPNYDRRKRLKFPGHDLTPNEIACFLSHRSLWIECASQEENYLILEDDAYGLRDYALADEMKSFLNLIEVSVENGYVVRLGNGGYRKVFKKIKNINEEFKLVRYKKDPLCALAYVISPKTARKLIEKSEKFYLPVDDFMWNTNESGCVVLDVDPYFLYAPLEDNPSTIGCRKKPKQGLIKKLFREANRFLYQTKLLSCEYFIYFFKKI